MCDFPGSHDILKQRLEFSEYKGGDYVFAIPERIPSASAETIKMRKALEVMRHLYVVYQFIGSRRKYDGTVIYEYQFYNWQLEYPSKIR